jgi:Ni/Fe-hydrogenase subunit HybB-like protein
MKPVLRWPRWSFWGWCFAALMAASIYAYHARSSLVAANVRDSFPWDLSIGLNVVVGIALCAGSFTLATTIRIFNLDDCKPILRPCLLTGFVGYLVAFLGFLTTAGRTYHVGLWITPSPRLAIWGAVGLLIIFGGVVLLEFAPECCKRFGWPELPRVVRQLSLPLLLLAAVLSVLQQTSFALLIVGASDKVSPLWSSPQLPFLFFVSAACGALAMMIFASWHTGIAIARGIPGHLVTGMGKALGAMLFFYLMLRCADFLGRGVPLVVLKNDLQHLLFGLEFALFFLPMWLLVAENHPMNPRVVYYCSALVLAGLITNRLNTCITSVEAGTGLSYLPSGNEFIIAYSVIALGVAIFSTATKRLPVFSELAA